MLRWPNIQGVMGDDPPYLVVGTEVSAKYKGAFCEAKVRKVVRSVKCKVNFKVGGSAIVADDLVRGTLRAGSVVEAKHPDRKEFVEACISKIQDCSQYTVVFDDGDITTLRRTALCLKSGRHFAESETLDQLPLTHPEHFGNPVVGNRRGGRRSRNPLSDESSEEEDEPPKGKLKEEREVDIGKVVCVELGDKKKQKDNWFPGLVVHPAAQEVVRIRVKDEYLVRSFKDGRYFTVPKKEASEFTREIAMKVDNNTLKTAVDKALLYLDKDELPPHWDRDVIFGLEEASTASDSDAAFESDSSDDEPREEKDHFVAQLYKFMDDRGTPINRGPVISGRDVDLYKLFKIVHTQGGYNRVTNHSQWKMVSHKVGFGQFSNTANLVKVAYKKYLHSFEEFYRKLGCTMVNHPRGSRVRHRGGRNLIRDKDRTTPVDVPRSDGKDKGSDTIDDEEETQVKVEEGVELSVDEKDDDPAKQRETKEVDVVTKPSRPPSLECKPVDPQQKAGTPRGKPKRSAESSANKNTVDLKKKNVVPKVKVVRAVDDDNDEAKSINVEDLDDEDEDKLTTTRSKTKEDLSKPKSDIKNNLEADKKPRSNEVTEKRIKPSLTATVEKKIGRPSLTSTSEKKGKVSQDGDRKTVRSLTAEFEKKARGSEVDKKETSCTDSEKRSKTYSVNDHEKKIRPSLTATLERKKSVAVDSDKKSRHGDSEKKIRPSLTADPERKKVRPSLTADPAKKVSRIDNEKKKDKALKLPDTDDTDKKSKIHESDRKNSTSESGRSSVGDFDKKSSKSDSGDSEKRGNPKLKRGEEDKKKHHARKRKDNDEASADDALDLLPNYKNVCIGDKLKVYYGPTHESKVTYEAKVLEVEGQGQDETYLVHYTGWNNRYDEWIKRSRIADNVSWSPARGKRRHQTPISALKKSTTVKKRNITSARDGVSPLQKDQSTTSFLSADKCRDPQPPRSSTPSSVTSSSSRTKSPAMRPGSARVTRNTLGDSSQQSLEQPLRRTRTRRTSGQTDLPSDSDSDGSGSESEVEPSTTRKNVKRQASDKDDDSIKKENTYKKKSRKREVEVGADEDEDKVKAGDKEDSRDGSKDEDDVSSESPSEEKLPVKRTRKGGRGTADVKGEGEEEEALPSASNTGMDLDLNQIRSELKGIDKAVKASSNEEAEPEGDGVPNIDMDTASLLESKASTLLEPEECTLDMEDIYEFKEPEPFEFEVRTKREPSAEPATKLQKRPPARIFDDVEPIRKKALKPNIFESESSADEAGSPVKKNFRQTPSKKDGTEMKSEDISTSVDLEKVSDPITPQKKMLSPMAEDAFEKLRQSPSFRLSAGSPVRPLTPPSTISSSVSTLGMPQSSGASPSPSTSNSILTPAVTVLNQPSQIPALKAVPILPPKTLTLVPDPTLITPPLLKYSSPHDAKSGGAVKSIQPAIVSSTSSSHPPVLSAIVKIPSEISMGSKPEEWLKANHQSSEKAELKKDDQISIKIEKDDSLPPLIPTTRCVPSSGRSSPDPPQLLPIPGLTPKILQDTPVIEAKEVQMPQIKIETSIDIEPVTSSSKTSPVSFRPETPVQDDDLSDDDCSRKSFRRKVQIKRKKAVSKEFVEDSDSDSSDAESRLVIESESSDSASETDEATSSMPFKDGNSKWCFSGKLGTLTHEEEKAKLLQKGDVSSQSKDMSSSNTSEDEALEDPPSVLKAEDPEELEIDNNLCSLYCEETIPGSPAPPCDVPADVNIEPSSSISSDRPLENNRASCKVLEMPFASVPGNTRSSGPGSSSPVTTSVGKLSHGDKQELDVGATMGGSAVNPGEATPVIENTPPLTPDSSMSTLSNSPRGEHGDSLYIVDNESIKSHRDSEDADNKDNDFSDDDVDVGTRMKRLTEKREKERGKMRCDADSASPNKKRRRSGKSSENEDRTKKPRHSSTRGVGQGSVSDSDDNSESPTQVTVAPQNQALSGSQAPLSSAGGSNSQPQTTYVPRSKYNFLVELTPDLDASQRIAKLMHSIQELRKKYAQVKQELATIDRRRKKLRRREREARLEARQRMREERRQARDEVVN